jgi:hypothetical protein
MTAIHGSHIEHPVAYENAIKRNILANAQLTFSRTYPEYREILDFIAAGRKYKDDQVCGYEEGFLGSLAHAYDTYGKLTLGQVNAVLKSIEKRNARRAEWADKKAALDATRQHVGTVGEKITLTLTIGHIVVLEGMYGTTFIYIMEDADKNVVIYKGNSDAVAWTPEGQPRGKGDTLTITATVKEHGVREGVKQTIIQRPKKVVDKTI